MAHCIAFAFKQKYPGQPQHQCFTELSCDMALRDGNAPLQSIPSFTLRALTHTMFPMFTYLLTAFPPLLHHVASNLVDTACPVVTKALKDGHCLPAGAPGIAQLCFRTEQTI